MHVTRVPGGAVPGMIEQLATPVMVTAQMFLAFVGISALLYLAAFVVAEARSLLARVRDDEPAPAATVPDTLSTTLAWVPADAAPGPAGEDAPSVTWDGTWGGPGEWVDLGGWR
ncbi:MAG: hypothetical protein Q4G43_10175 [Mobilicoccus sp.]|nr:hypothetical protein [Mobilicoccus sp.]